MPYKPKYPPKKAPQKGTGRGRKKKEIEPIRGIGSTPEQSLVVQKSLPLFNLWRSPLSLAEFKILDAYLARIDTHDEEHRTVIFKKGEIEQILGVPKINIADLKKRLTTLLGQVVNINDGTRKKGFCLITLFDRAEAEQDDDGQWTVEMKCSEDARRYIFHVDKLGYLRYALHNIVNLSSRYSYILFCYLEQQRWKQGDRPWDVPLDQLKMILNCPDNETYSEYKHFNNLVLKKCFKELNEKTDCRFSYEPVKEGKKVKAIRFTLVKRTVVLEQAVVQQMQNEEQMLIGEYELLPSPQEKWLILAQKACTPADAGGSEFDSDKLAVLWHLACSLPDSSTYHGREASEPMEYVADALRYWYLTMNEKAPKRNRYGYLVRMLEEKVKTLPKADEQPSSVLDQAGEKANQDQLNDILWLQKFMEKYEADKKKED